MEALPQEIADEIFGKIWGNNPQDLYNLRLVSKTWKNVIDRFISRLLKMWCKKCSNEIPEGHLDDFVKTKHPKFASWRSYCSSELLVIPHIARDIYLSWTKFPNLVGDPRITEIWSSETSDQIFMQSYAVNEKYFAVCLTLRARAKNVVRIYLNNNLTDHIKEYPISCKKIDFITTNNQVFVILQERKYSCNHDNCKRISLAEFLVNDSLVHYKPSSGVSHDKTAVHCMKYTITENQCFTFSKYCNSFQHLKMTSNGFKVSTIVQLPCTSCRTITQILKMQICNSNKLIVNVIYANKISKIPTRAIYLYQIARQLDGKLLFSSPEIHYQSPVMIFQEVSINYFEAENIRLQIFFRECYSSKFKLWVKHFFGRKSDVLSLTLYAYHVIILCGDKLIVFRGDFRQLMEYTVTNSCPSSRCNVIDFRQTIKFGFGSNPVQVIHSDSKHKFLVAAMQKILIIDLIP